MPLFMSKFITSDRILIYLCVIIIVFDIYGAWVHDNIKMILMNISQPLSFGFLEEDNQSVIFTEFIS